MWGDPTDGWCLVDETSGTNLDLPTSAGARRAAGEASSARTLWRAEAWRPAAWTEGGEGPGQENQKSLEDGEEGRRRRSLIAKEAGGEVTLQLLQMRARRQCRFRPLGGCAVVRVRDGDEQGSVACGRGKRRLSIGAFSYKLNF